AKTPSPGNTPNGVIDSGKPMTLPGLSRRAFLRRTTATAVATAGVSLLWSPVSAAPIPMPKSAGPLDEKLDAFIASYMAAMNAPGMTLGLTDPHQTLRTAGYGLADIDRRISVT